MEGVQCARLTLTENGGAAVIAPKCICSPRQHPRPISFLQPWGRSFLPYSGLQKVLEVFHWMNRNSKVGLKSWAESKFTVTMLLSTNVLQSCREQYINMKLTKSMCKIYTMSLSHASKTGTDFMQYGPTLSDRSLEQGLPLLEVWAVSSKQQSGTWSCVLQTSHRLSHFCKQLQLLSKGLNDHCIFLAQPLYNNKKHCALKKMKCYNVTICPTPILGASIHKL